MSRCSRCGSTDVDDREVEKLVRGGEDAAVLHLRATVCHHCGERYLPLEAIRTVERVRRDLQQGDVSAYRAVGRLLSPEAESAS